jgi:hypothetical protein
MIRRVLDIHVLLHNVSAENSCMSKAACRASLSLLLAASGWILNEPKPANHSEIMASFQVGGSYEWLRSLLDDRDADARSDALLIVAALCADVHGALAVLSLELYSRSTRRRSAGQFDSDLDVLSMADLAIMIMLDHTEPLIVRAAASKVRI